MKKLRRAENVRGLRWSAAAQEQHAPQALHAPAGVDGQRRDEVLQHRAGSVHAGAGPPARMWQGGAAGCATACEAHHDDGPGKGLGQRRGGARDGGGDHERPPALAGVLSVRIPGGCDGRQRPGPPRRIGHSAGLWTCMPQRQAMLWQGSCWPCGQRLGRGTCREARRGTAAAAGCAAHEGK